MEAVLQTKELYKFYGSSKRPVLQGLTMTVNRGDIYAFVGRNGAGKTTLMRIALGLAFATRGTISLFGKDPSYLAESRARIGAVIETPGLYEKVSAYENMRRFSILRGGDDSDIWRLLDFVGLADAGLKDVASFSLGMRQRLGIAVALLGDPEFLILDEPVNGLDPAGIRDVRDLILRLKCEKGMTVLISSHLLDELSRVATRYGILRAGKLVEEFDADELRSRCPSVLRLTTDQPEQVRDLLSKRMDPRHIHVQNGEIYLTQYVDRGAQINQYLFENGVALQAIVQESQGAEAYFVERMGGNT